jgi:lipoprotein-releasing system permease protein
MSSKPFGLFERMLAGRYLRAKRAHGGVAMISVISVIGVMLAVAVLIVTMSVMNGFRETLLSRILGVNGHVFIDTRGMPTSEIDRIAAIVRETRGVTHVAPMVIEQGLATADGVAAGIQIRGMKRDDLQALSLISSSIRPGGSLSEFQGIDSPTLIIGDRLAASLGVVENMAISVVSPQGAATPFGLVPRRKAFLIGGIFSVGMQEADQLIVYMPLEQAQVLFSRGEGVDRLEIRLNNPDRTLPVMMALRDRLGPDVVIYDWRAESAGLSDALVVERNVMRLILMMIVAIAALNIWSGLVMLVKNKSRDVAILRTMGATSGSILRIFFMCGAAVGIIGTLAGVLLGVGVATFIKPIQDFISYVIGFDVFPGSVYSLDTLPAKVEWPEVGLIVFWALLMSFLATLPQSWRASRLDPVEALRYE